MCGRSTLTRDPVEFMASQGAPTAIPGFRPRFNIAPSQDQWALVLGESGQPEIRALRWGLVPPWAKDPSIGNRMINARAESVAEKPSYRVPLRKTRCLILADGYYEWTKTDSGKAPIHFQLSNHRAFAFAGLWARWDSGPQSIESCTVITTAASEACASYHHRMPVILDEQSASAWLAPESPQRDILDLLQPYNGDDLEMYEVSRLVNSPANDTPECIERIGPLD